MSKQELTTSSPTSGRKADLLFERRKDEPLIPPPPPTCRSAACPVGRVYPTPDDDACYALWDKYDMPQHIREHSQGVADVATEISHLAASAGMRVDVQSVRASALLHDIAKAYTIEFGGNHAQLGGVWVMNETGNPLVAQGVVHHVYWPWQIDDTACFLPLNVIYADKRVQHDTVVSLDARFEDLRTRYGRNDFILERIEVSRKQAVAIEELFSNLIGVDLNACTFDSRRMV